MKMRGMRAISADVMKGAAPNLSRIYRPAKRSKIDFTLIFLSSASDVAPGQKELLKTTVFGELSPPKLECSMTRLLSSLGVIAPS